jgi:hypothetical protein
MVDGAYNGWPSSPQRRSAKLQVWRAEGAFSAALVGLRQRRHDAIS